MFNGQKITTTGACHTTVDYSGRPEEMSLKVSAPAESLGSRLEATYYALSRIEDRVEHLKRLLFGESDPQCDTDRGLSCIDEGVNGIKYRAANVERELDNLIFKLSGN